MIVGGLSALMRYVLRYFFKPDGFNLSIGMKLQVGETQQTFMVKAALGLFIQDGKACQLMNSFKGAAGWKCCHECRNILNTQPHRIAHHRYYHHYALATPDMFDEHTNESLLEYADHLERSYSTMGKTAFKLQQKAIGITYCAEGLLWDKYLRTFYQPANHNCQDGMHVLVASGGVAQIEMSGFLAAVYNLELGITAEKLDKFHSQVFKDGRKALARSQSD
eukprot:4440070-Karenia_brevis.AAC.1